ncbi:MAG: tRNA (N6-isopentenyl adenosine(37)-C2)-methylthiotransferase MiaB [Firmicutes bacterium]|nr:tRNA (N6-isopentenyl adenosine(37)-C2)-methylthiotransferase MiaB [Bacillota bacterium]
MSIKGDSPQKYLIITFGCQMNEHDSEHISGLLEGIGYTPAEDQSDADIIVVNTCCVRESAENKVFGLLGRLGRLKKQNPGLILCLGGCMSQQEHMAPRIKQRFSYIDVVFGTYNTNQLPELIDRTLNSGKQVIEVWPANGGIVEDIPVKRRQRVRAWVSITYGCNNFCTYCIVPHVRGRERSRTPGDVGGELETLGREGYRDVTLLGQNVNSYGRDLGGAVDFADLLHMADGVAGIERIRFMTSHPRDFCDKLVEAVVNLPKVCEHIHLPVQAGSNAILQSMNRGYTREYYLGLVDKIKTAIPGVALTTDIMVGFPGETEAHFLDTLDLVRQVEYESAFTFVYNPRRGTPAAGMTDQVSDKVKSARIQELIELQNTITLQKNRAEVGRVLECLVEGTSRTNRELMGARTRTGKIVVYHGTPEQIGALLTLRVTGYSLTHLEGEVAAG